MLGRAAEEEEEEEEEEKKEGRGRWVSLARSLFLACFLSWPHAFPPPRGARPLSLALALSFLGAMLRGR